MIIAYPPTDDPVIVGLVASLNKAVKAKFYVALSNAEAGSGFYCHAGTLKEARAAARAHLKKYPTWDRAVIYTSNHGEQGERLAWIKRSDVCH